MPDSIYFCFKYSFRLIDNGQDNYYICTINFKQHSSFLIL